MPHNTTLDLTGIALVNLFERNITLRCRFIRDDLTFKINRLDIFDLLFVCDQAADTAVIDNMSDLLGFEQSCDRYKNILCREYSKYRDDAIGTLPRIYPYSAPFFQSDRRKIVRDLIDSFEKLRIGIGFTLQNKCDFIRLCSSGVF